MEQNAFALFLDYKRNQRRNKKLSVENGENGGMSCHILWDAVKVLLRVKIISIKAHIYKQE